MGLAITILRFIYVLCIVILALYTCGQLYLLYTYIRLSYVRLRRNTKPAQCKAGDDQLPRVTVQLPLFNERYVVRRVIDAVAALDYPRDRLHIQVLDDSTDDTTELVQGRVAQLQAEGLHIDLIHRARRTGYKAGALACGFAQTDGELIAIFDADFVPAPDFLRRTVPYFLADERIGVVQARWGHLNDDDNLLTRSQALAIDGHFAIEQYTRSAADLTFNFNGSCGLWRRTCIEEAGGWQSETLTEDFDLSYRAQIRGWRFVFVRDVVVPGEIPPHIVACKQQQARWAKGSTQVLLKLAWPLLSSHLNLRKKAMGFLQLFQYAIQPVLLATLALTPLMMVTHSLDDLPMAPLGILGLVVPLLYTLCILSQRALYPDWVWRSLYFPVLMIFSSGMIVNNSRAAISAILGGAGEFKRTPKVHTGGQPNRRKHNQYVVSAGNDVAWEIGFGLYTLVAALMAESIAPSFVPYFLIYALAFFSVAGWELAEGWTARQPQQPVSSPRSAETEPVGQPGR